VLNIQPNIFNMPEGTHLLALIENDAANSYATITQSQPTKLSILTPRIFSQFASI
jgi:hypothetical protein